MSEACLSDASMMQRTQSSHTHQTNNSVSVDDLYAQYGSENVEQAVMNFVAEYLKKGISSMIEQLPLPQFQIDQALQMLNSSVQQAASLVPAGAQSGVEQYASNQEDQSCNDSMDGILSMIQKSMQDETSAASKGAGGQGGGGNWLTVLARALGKVAGEHLKKMVELGEKMGQLDSKEQASEFAKTQAEFQAESQIFKMFQEAIGTMVKSIGEGMTSVARKQ